MSHKTTTMPVRNRYNVFSFVNTTPNSTYCRWRRQNDDAALLGVQQTLQEHVLSSSRNPDNRIEKNLKIVSKTLLVDLPDDQSFTVQEFVDMQRKHIVTRSRLLQVLYAEL